PLLVGAILMTGSRSAVIAVLAAFVLGVALARGAGLFKRVIVAVACTVAVVYIAVVVVQSDMLDAKSRDRIEEFVRARGDVGDSRLDIWNLGFQTYAEAPVIGVGFGNAAFTLERSRGWFRDMHSSYLSVLVDGGAIGLMLFGYGLWQLFRRVRGIRASPAAIPASIMLCLLLASALTHTIHFTKWFWVPATICLLLAEQAHRERSPANQAVAEPGAITTTTAGSPIAARSPGRLGYGRA
ncbi:MAG: O-antigen ligase family protein, partial [Planctomycetes bacterium]|nr:O-antigen ligase family protein [Planctomycetota bacterium]